MSGSSVSRRPQALRLDDRICPHCGREMQAGWDEFPQALLKKYDQQQQETGEHVQSSHQVIEHNG